MPSLAKAEHSVGRLDRELDGRPIAVMSIRSCSRIGCIGQAQVSIVQDLAAVMEAVGVGDNDPCLQM